MDPWVASRLCFSSYENTLFPMICLVTMLVSLSPDLQGWKTRSQALTLLAGVGVESPAPQPSTPTSLAVAGESLTRRFPP
jgi:hypothetical protein